MNVIALNKLTQLCRPVFQLFKKLCIRILQVHYSYVSQNVYKVSLGNLVRELLGRWAFWHDLLWLFRLNYLNWVDLPAHCELHWFFGLESLNEKKKNLSTNIHHTLFPDCEFNVTKHFFHCHAFPVIMNNIPQNFKPNMNCLFF